MKLDHQNVFFISDLHLGHSNIIKYDNRPFKDVDEMHIALIKNWNKVVKDDSVVFYLGDLSFKNDKLATWFLNQVPGKIHTILGNHDRLRDILNLKRFEAVHEYGTEINVLDKDDSRGSQHIVMSHYPILSWNRGHHGSWHLHGHSHQSLTKNKDYDWYYKRKVLDLGCNGWDYTPQSYAQIKEAMSKKIVASDHHND